MGKSSNYTPPYSGGTVNINGQTKAKTYKSGGNIVSDYNMSDAEKRIYDYAQNSFADSLSKVNVFDDDAKKDMQRQLDAYTRNGQKIINNLYTPMLNDLKTDIASRFRNYDNSVFLDKLNSIESSRADFMNSLAQDILAKGDELKQNELTNRYKYLGFLQDVQNNIDTNILNYIGAARDNSNSANGMNSYSRSNSDDNWRNFTNFAESMAKVFM